MITLEILFARIPELHSDDLARWIENRWVRPETEAGTLVFAEIDLARIQLIRELRDELEVNEAALPVVLNLLDQLYDLRRALRETQSK
jgi:chaperone modulatory protein CbpM